VTKLNSIPIDPFSFILGALIVAGIVWANQGKPWHRLFDGFGDDK
jgi:hypothetical protein